MANQENHNPQSEDLVQGLRQALMRLTSPHYEELHQQIDSLQASLDRLNTQLLERDEALERTDEELDALIKETQGKLTRLEASLVTLDQSLHDKISEKTYQLSDQLSKVQADLVDPQEVTQRITPAFLPVLTESARTEQDEFAQAVGPVIGPAIRHQIRESKQDIIDSLYPIIGQIISRAIAESIRELTRNIDTRMRRQFDFRSQLRHLMARLQGVSGAEMLLRDSLPYRVQHIFLIHRPTGILLKHISSLDKEVEDADIVSGMLTAIRDFVRDSFGEEVGELDEITHGERRFLIESGMNAYLAVVLEGVEPSGYHALISQTTHEINLNYESELRNFNGELYNLPSFTENLAPLLEPEAALAQEENAVKPMSRNQKWVVTGILTGILLLLGLMIFACIFTVRLWPLAFPGPTATPAPTMTATMILSPTPTTEPSNTPTESLSPTPTFTFTPSPTLQPTNTPTPQPTPYVQTGSLRGDLNLRSGPSTQFRSLGVIKTGEQVIILEQRDFWLHVQWPLDGEPLLDGWLWSQYVILTPIP